MQAIFYTFVLNKSIKNCLMPIPLAGRKQCQAMLGFLPDQPQDFDTEPKEMEWGPLPIKHIF